MIRRESWLKAIELDAPGKIRARCLPPGSHKRIGVPPVATVLPSRLQATEAPLILLTLAPVFRS